MRFHINKVLTAALTGTLCVSSFAFSSDPSQTQQDQKKLETFQKTVSGAPVPFTRTAAEKSVKIALIYPSADISDFWVRNYTALIERLKDLEVPFKIVQYTSKQIEHSLQTQYTQQVLNAAKPYDFVIFGPSELSLQSGNIQKLSASNDFKTFIWAFHTPDSQWQHQPDAWFDFSSAMGAEVLCQHVIKHLGNEVDFAANRGIPGITDTQRSQGFIDCVREKGDWFTAYEHFGQYQKLGGADGVKLVLDNFPEVTMIHNANTAMTMGAIDALAEAGKLSDIYVTGWGGTAKEIEKIRSDELDATPMRMSDDLGVATAEAIKFHLENRADEIPLIYLGRISVVHNEMENAELDKLTHEAFRYSGVSH
ncbi:substrate-binding domain-containing protein [Vibrio neptunius]|uniref:Autoinducer 2-binding periplasmic protein LuxP n=1 Tax=Vibrio neptunius TaxID=170651 RepID=A0ABS3A127_9VIBR|nr:substrate-binding domain-containing protein [Vibrio neptunius]MBN3492914.1 substrate-binding domain-containing protein [Vibrio neptunius]MBN3515368.1 substrate-binding domain-containing protein [Vibrio neptunius]MBN3549446.1 substrate-binding domain-containing protein [Vibrio neptunius]MBN3577715.1 substrate-binding domain-containing protein [Vibrio neptunius]MCH9871379.1 substrate-binding domain-containing protein [Vibrio neptunius]